MESTASPRPRGRLNLNTPLRKKMYVSVWLAAVFASVLIAPFIFDFTYSGGNPDRSFVRYWTGEYYAIDWTKYAFIVSCIIALMLIFSMFLFWDRIKAIADWMNETPTS